MLNQVVSKVTIVILRVTLFKNSISENAVSLKSLFRSIYNATSTLKKKPKRAS